MDSNEYMHLAAERVELQRILAGVPEQDVLTRSSFTTRLEEIDGQLTANEMPIHQPARARLTFRGRPVIGQRGVFADFGTKATNAFADTVAKVAAGLSGTLSPMGPIPNREASQLLITSTAVGSFGFEFEEYRPADQLDSCEESLAAQALAATKTLMQSTTGTDDELADSAASTDPRAVEAMRSFLELLATNEAVCALEHGDRVFRFSDVGQVRRAVTRLGRDNLREERMQLVGEFQGVLPRGRTFEFKLTGDDQVIRGKVGLEITDVDIINQHLHREIAIDVLATRVGNGRPRFVLIAIPGWPDEV